MPHHLVLNPELVIAFCILHLISSVEQASCAMNCLAIAPGSWGIGNAADWPDVMRRSCCIHVGLAACQANEFICMGEWYASDSTKNFFGISCMEHIWLILAL